jgi:putative acetyltransferase
MEIREDDLTGPEIMVLLREHLDHMYAITPLESVHALDLDALRAPEITFWTAWDGRQLLGCGALKALDARRGEIKSMRTASAFRRQGVAAKMLEYIMQEAQKRGYVALYLETGSTPEFAPAMALYQRYDFRFRAPFADYIDDPNSVFMEKRLV